jgi:hypothetical protein
MAKNPAERFQTADAMEGRDSRFWVVPNATRSAPPLASRAPGLAFAPTIARASKRTQKDPRGSPSGQEADSC